MTSIERVTFRSTRCISRAVVAVVTLAAVAAGPCPLNAQGLTGQISGTVVDSGGGVVPGASVTIRNAGTLLTRHTTTGMEGTFVFPDLLAGTYHVTVALVGFKTAEHNGIGLASTDRLTLRTIVLEVGGLKDTVTVTNAAPLVQTSNGARSGTITSANFEDISLKGRDFAGMLKVLPGVVDAAAREAPGWQMMSGLSINGRSIGLNVSYDGVTNKTGSNDSVTTEPALDSIAEVRVQASNFQAEYGRSSGATIAVVTRSGSKTFRGSAAFYKRDDALNGNEFARKAQCGLGYTELCGAALYRFDNYAWTLGGPVLVPGTTFNKGRNKLFFFWSQEILLRTDPGMLNPRRMPTALERAGDFSQTFDGSKKMIFIRDPERSGTCNSQTGGPACFTDNRIPANRIDATAQALLNLFPMPNASDPTGANQYNYTYQTVTDWPRNDQVVRLDWNIGPATTAYGRLQFGYDGRAGAASTFGATSGWPQMVTRFESEAVSYVNTLLHAFSPTLFSEVMVGVNWGYQHASPLNQAELDRNDRSKVLPGLPPFFPAANPLNLLPQATFSGLPGVNANLGSFGIERRFPFYGYSTLWNFSGNLTRLAGPHNIKTGIFVEHTTRPVRQRSSFNGTLSFNTDGSHPQNTNIGFANALLGAVTSYQESDVQPVGHGQFMNTEFYVQDNWRPKRSFTVDAGVRFYYITPTTNQGDNVVQFEQDAFSASAAPLLFQPITAPQGRRAVNPLTGEILPAVYIGRLVPDSGDFTNGMVLYDGTPQRTSPFRVAPRLGFAWDVTGDGNTAIRGGAGVFYRSIRGKRHPRPGRAAAARAYLHDRLHDDSGPPGQPPDDDD